MDFTFWTSLNPGFSFIFPVFPIHQVSLDFILHCSFDLNCRLIWILPGTSWGISDRAILKGSHTSELLFFSLWNSDHIIAQVAHEAGWGFPCKAQMGWPRSPFPLANHQQGLLALTKTALSRVVSGYLLDNQDMHSGARTENGESLGIGVIRDSPVGLALIRPHTDGLHFGVLRVQHCDSVTTGTGTGEVSCEISSCSDSIMDFSKVASWPCAVLGLMGLWAGVQKCAGVNVHPGLFDYIPIKLPKIQ